MAAGNAGERTKANARVEVWFEFASTYSYPAVARIGPLARAAGVELAWRPFLLGPIFAQQGWKDSPFNLYPAKGAYMWLDVERTARAHGLPFRRPSQFPRNGLHAARVAMVAAAEGWCEDFATNVYRANFADDLDIADQAVVGGCVRDCGRDPEAALAAAQSPENKDALRSQTERALERGVFGAPTFFADSEMFWGNDRLESALARAAEAAGD